MKDVTHFSERLLTERKKLGLSQEEFADKVGVSTSIVSNWENMVKFPALENAISVSNVLGVSLDYLCGEDKNEPETKPEIKLKSVYDVVKFLEYLDNVLICEFSHEEIDTGKKDSTIQSVDINSETLFANIDHVAVIKIHNHGLANFISRKNKIKGLLKELIGEIPINDQEDYEDWHNGAIGKLKNIPVKKEIALTWSKDEEQKIREYMKSLKE